ncbi:hypothetical protein TNCT_255811 [Trichonephila clavata]|uniref:Uncharacterized protein n=1 Tax=Trichonephila clavata TaxID=2740835 RepID=A0A8X6GVR7_TRICU|nr:hypothetical protein TNCT_255811 [Trichonephila clavata]
MSEEHINLKLRHGVISLTKESSYVFLPLHIEIRLESVFGLCMDASSKKYFPVYILGSIEHDVGTSLNWQLERVEHKPLVSHIQSTFDNP